MGMRGSLKTGMALGGVTLAIEALAVLPGRIAIARGQAQFGRSPVEVAIAGTLRDLSDIVLPIGIVLTVALTIALLVRFASGEKARRVAAVRTLVAGVTIAGILVWFTSAAAAEFKMQRGVDATWFDVQIAMHTTAAGRTFLGFLVCRRHYVPGLASLVAAVLVILAMRGRARAWSMERRLPVVAGFAAIMVVGWLGALAPLDPHVRVFRTISDRHIVGEPFVDLFATFGRSQENVRLGMRGLIETATYPAAHSTGGEAILGVPVIGSSGVDCGAHPFARGFTEHGIEAARPGTSGHHALDPEAALALQVLDRLSGEIFLDRKTPIDVWQLMLESFRGDDIHAIAPSAPRELAPFTNGLYESAEKGDRAVVAVHRMWQAGARTSQGLSSYMCGMGMLPYGLSITRDFGPVPLRCLPDVLVDAKLEGSFFSVGNPSFDEMDPFFRHHGITDISGRLQLPLDSPMGQEGVTDRALYGHAAGVIARRSGTHGRYVLLMSGSNHIPFGRPDDLPKEIDERVEALRALPAFVGSADDIARLRTFAYADFAVEELVGRLTPNLDRTILVLGADHATGDPRVWANGTLDLQASHALIPFAIFLPEPLVARSANPERVRELVRELNATLAQHAWSQNDVPLFLLTLLSRSPGFATLAPEQRWHTLGGERTSPYFTALATASGEAPAKVVGIDAMSELFAANDADQSLLPLPHETASFVRNPAEIYTASPTLIPVAATLSRYLNGYVSTCKQLSATAVR